MQASACDACICVGVHRITASTSGRARLSDSSVVTCPTENFFATSWRLIQLAAHQRRDLHAVDLLNAFEMFDAERAGAGERDFDGAHYEFSRIR